MYYINGRYLARPDALVHTEDRGHQFADGVYEVIAFYNRTLLDGDRHMKRLERSLGELGIAPPMAMRALKLVMAELIERANLADGTIYLQVTRGCAKRDHPFPKSAKPSLTMNTTGPKRPKPHEVEEGVKVITRPDIRWGRRDIKTISLLPNCLAKNDAAQAGAREAWLVEETGIITEGAVSNAYIVKKGAIVTHPKTHAILPGITRDVALALARKAGMRVEERPFTLKEALTADEAFLTSTTSNVLPIVRIDGKPVGDGAPGRTTLRLLSLYLEHIRRETGGY